MVIEEGEERNYWDVKSIRSTLNIRPYNCVGVVKADKKKGVGTILSSNLILTSGHLLYTKQKNGTYSARVQAKEAFFRYGDKKIKVKDFKVP